MSSGYAAVIREDPAITQARAKYEECRRQHSRLSALAARHARSAGVVFTATPMQAPAAYGRAIIDAARKAQAEVDALQREVKRLATMAFEVRLRDVLPVSRGAELLMFAPDRAASAGESSATPRDGAKQTRLSPRQRDVREAAELLKDLEEEIEAPPWAAQLVREIAQTGTDSTRQMRLDRLERAVKQYHAYTRLVTKAGRFNDTELDRMLQDARRRLDVGALDDAQALLDKARDRADQLHDEAADRAVEEYVRRSLAEVLAEIGGEIVDDPDVILPTGGRLVRWPGAERPSATLRTERRKDGGVEVRMEPVIVVDGDASRPRAIAEAGAYQEAEFCELLSDVEKGMAERELSPQPHERRVDPPRKSIGAAEVRRNRQTARARASTASATRKPKLKEKSLPYG